MVLDSIFGKYGNGGDPSNLAAALHNWFAEERPDAERQVELLTTKYFSAAMLGAGIAGNSTVRFADVLRKYFTPEVLSAAVAKLDDKEKQGQ